MRLEVNIDKKYFFAFVLIGLIIIGIVGVIAYNSVGVPATFGHSVNEIDWGQKINANLSINGSVNIIGNVSASMVCINGVCNSVWPSAGTGGVSKIINGSGIIISPPNGLGEVTINATGGLIIPTTVPNNPVPGQMWLIP